jgi:hypothetical protein
MQEVSSNRTVGSSKTVSSRPMSPLIVVGHRGHPIRRPN